MNEKLIELDRGTYNNAPAIEVSHFGSIAVVDGNGSVVHALGDVSAYTHLRSTAKPFQLIPFLIRRLHEKYHLDDADIALLMSSHAGEPEQVARVAAMLSKMSINPGELQCGIHAPTHDASRRELFAKGERPNVLHNNCSGKHAAMIATAKSEGWDENTYLDINHPLQREIAGILRDVGGVDESKLGTGIDGCSAPTFIMPLEVIARLYARLAYPSTKYAKELALLFRAGSSNPYMIAGTKRLDTILMQTCPGVLFAKTGADGVYTMAVAASEKYPMGLGIAFKIVDGDSASRARTAVAAEILFQLGILESTAQIYDPTIKSLRGVDAGMIRATFRLA